MVIRKFIEEIGEKVLPARRKSGNGGLQQQQYSYCAPTQQGSGGPWQSPFSNSFAGAENECATAIRKFLLSHPHFAAPSDLVVFFNEIDDVVILAGTVRDAKIREQIVQAAGNIQGVEKVDDRMTFTLPGGWR
jgi:hypothetical protein